MGIFDKVKKLADNIEKKVENLDDSIKKYDDKLSEDEPEVVETSVEQDEPKSEGETNNEPVTACCGAPFSTEEFQSESMCTL